MIFKTTVRNCRIELEVPYHIPDGTEAEVRINEPDEDEMTPEVIERLLKAMDELGKLEFTEEERAETERWRAAMKKYTIENMNRDIENLFE